VRMWQTKGSKLHSFFFWNFSERATYTLARQYDQRSPCKSLSRTPSPRFSITPTAINHTPGSVACGCIWWLICVCNWYESWYNTQGDKRVYRRRSLLRRKISMLAAPQKSASKAIMAATGICWNSLRNYKQKMITHELINKGQKKLTNMVRQPIADCLLK
jgi:hypothetical protein